MGQHPLIDQDLSARAEFALDELGHLALDFSSGTNTAPRNVVFAAATIAEVFTDDALAQLVRESAVQHSRLGRALIRQTNDSFTQSWDARLDWLKAGYDVNLASLTETQRLRTVIDLRNALAHGGGSLTARLTRDLTKLLDLERRLNTQLGTKVNGRRIAMSSQTPMKAVTIVYDFVLRADAGIRQAITIKTHVGQ